MSIFHLCLRGLVVIGQRLNFDVADSRLSCDAEEFYETTRPILLCFPGRFQLQVALGPPVRDVELILMLASVWLAF